MNGLNSLFDHTTYPLWGFIYSYKSGGVFWQSIAEYYKKYIMVTLCNKFRGTMK